VWLFEVQREKPIILHFSPVRDLASSSMANETETRG
jgi:hypothetical protein